MNVGITDRCGNKTGYEYDACGRTTKVTAKDADGVALSNVSYSYDSLDNLAEITRGDGMGYGMQYDAFHELESIGITGKDEKLVTYGYNSGHGRLKTVTYANGDTMKVAYNSQGQLVSEKWYDAANVLAASYRYVYDSQGTVIRSIDILNLKEYNYSYDEGRLLRAVECTITLDEYENVISKTTVNEIRYSYDTDGNMTGRRLVLEGGRELPVRQEASDSENRTVYFAGTSEIVSHSQTDALGRKAVDGIRFNSLDLYRQFSYHAGQITQAHIDNEKQQSGATTRLVSLITLYGGRTIAYEYDGEERITKVTDSRNGITEYTYDALGQLMTEAVNGVVVNTMAYDNYGNILTKNGKTYTYGNAVWKDLLVAYDGQGIFYDAQGNPTNYLGHTLTWEKGRQLKSFDNITYTYNANGIRTSKRVQGIKHTYALDGSKILQETWTNNYIVPLYDTDDAVCGMIYNGSPYFFQKNLQGDVIGITNVSGTIVARYSYDAWGACTILSDNTNGVATVNPFRYRGYYFDTETNLYYLQSRYYDPQTGRFINADSVEWVGTNGRILETNLFAYCGNDCIKKSDEAGYGGIDMLLEALGSCVDVVAKIIDMIGNSYIKQREELEKTVKILTKKQKQTLSNIKALQKQAKNLSKKLGWVGHAITFMTIVIGFAISYKTGNGIVSSIIDTVIESFIALVEFGAGEFFAWIARSIPYVGFLLGLIAGWLVSYLLGKFFNGERVERIKSKFSSLIKNAKVSLLEWTKCAVKSLTA